MSPGALVGFCVIFFSSLCPPDETRALFKVLFLKKQKTRHQFSVSEKEKYSLGAQPECLLD